MKKTKMINQPFESHFGNGKFTKITQDMMDTKVWEKLTLSQRGLYLELKSKFTKGPDETFNTNNISMPKGDWIKFYTSKITFDRDMDNLIELGFIRVILYQGNLRKPTIYGFSEQWKFYDTDMFRITNKDRRPKDTLTKEHKKSISDKVKKTLSNRYNPKVTKIY